MLNLVYFSNYEAAFLFFNLHHHVSVINTGTVVGLGASDVIGTLMKISVRIDRN